MSCSLVSMRLAEHPSKAYKPLDSDLHQNDEGTKNKGSDRSLCFFVGRLNLHSFKHRRYALAS
jgi:hypothetical protein